MKQNLTLAQLVAILEHNKANDRGTDICLLDEHSRLTIVPDRPLGDLINPTTWPRYICRVSSVTDHVDADTRAAAASAGTDAAVDGLFSALDHVNWALTRTPAPLPDLRKLVTQAASTTFTAIRGSLTGR